LLESTVTVASLYRIGSAAGVGVISPKVAALTEGVVKTMFLSKVKTALAAGLVPCLLAIGYGVMPGGAAATAWPFGAGLYL
jgi:hypothetical protein